MRTLEFVKKLQIAHFCLNLFYITQENYINVLQFGAPATVSFSSEILEHLRFQISILFSKLFFQQEDT